MTQSQIALRKLAVPQGQDIPTSQCSGFFPLTPALSLGERVNHALRGELATPVRLPPRVARCSLSLRALRERVRVRGNGAVYDPLYRTIPETENWASPSAVSEVSVNEYENCNHRSGQRRRNAGHALGQKRTHRHFWSKKPRR